MGRGGREREMSGAQAEMSPGKCRDAPRPRLAPLDFLHPIHPNWRPEAWTFGSEVPIPPHLSLRLSSTPAAVCPCPLVARSGNVTTAQ